MIFYRLTDRAFSRRWRRNKDYTEKQLRLLAKHTGSVVDKLRDGIDIKKGGKVLAHFQKVIREEMVHENQQASVYAALRNPARGQMIVHTVRAAVSVVK